MTDNKSKEINVKKCTYYYYLDDQININFVDSKKIALDKKLHKYVFIYYLGYEISSSI